MAYQIGLSLPASESAGALCPGWVSTSSTPRSLGVSQQTYSAMERNAGCLAKGLQQGRQLGRGAEGELGHGVYSL